MVAHDLAMDNGTTRLGIDIGRVIIDGSSHPSGDDTAFFKGGIENVRQTPVMPGAFDSITRLSELFDGRVWLVSKCGERVRERTREWLAHHRFFERTNIDAGHVRFCGQRPEKAIHCAELDITHFIDDRPDVLEALDGIVAWRYLFGAQRHHEVPRGALVATDWAAAEAGVRANFTRSAVRQVDPRCH